MAPKSIVHVRVRMPVAFHRKLMRDADRSGQTINGEILKRLEESYEIADQLNSAVEKLSEMSADIRARTAKIQSIQTSEGPKSDD
jgi:hypothetical protein